MRNHPIECSPASEKKIGEMLDEKSSNLIHAERVMKKAHEE